MPEDLYLYPHWLASSLVFCILLSVQPFLHGCLIAPACKFLSLVNRSALTCAGPKTCTLPFLVIAQGEAISCCVAQVLALPPLPLPPLKLYFLLLYILDEF